MDKELVFVYGTLMEGLAAHYLLEQEGVEKVGWGTIHGKLYDLGAYPAAIWIPDHVDGVIKGELYKVPPQYLRILDRYEGVEDGLYRRNKVSVVTKNNNVSWVDHAWVYFYNQEVTTDFPFHIEDGDYRKRLERRA